MQKPDTKITLAIMVALSLAAVPAVATDYHWKDSYPFGVWSSAANWTPSGGPPIGSGDKAYIGDALAGTYKSVLDITTTVGYLEIANPDSLDSAWLWTHGETLTVLGDTHLIETAANHAVQLFIDRGTGVDDFDTDRLDIDGGAELNMDGGIVEIDEQLDVDPSSHIVGYGLIKFSGSDARALSLAGTLRTDHATERLTLQVTGTGKLDLDGSSGGNSVIDVTYGTSGLLVDGQLSDPFDGTMTIGEDNGVRFTEPWTHRGTLEMNGGVGPAEAKLYNSGLEVNGVVNINSGQNIIQSDQAPILLNAGADMTVDNGAILRLSTSNSTVQLNTGSAIVVNGSLDFSSAFSSNVSYAGGTISGSGRIGQFDKATVDADTTVDIAEFRWGDEADTTIKPGNMLSINADITHPLKGVITVDSGTLTVITPSGDWIIDAGGDLILQKTGADIPTVNGSEVMTLEGAQIVIAGPADFNAPVTLEEGAQIFLFDVAGSELTLDGTTTLDGGDINGPKSDETVVQSSPLTVTGISSVAVSTYDWDQGPTTVEPGGVLTIASDHIDVGNNRYDATITINSGSLAVNTSAAWTMNGLLNLNNTTGTIPLLAGQNLSVGNGVGAADAVVNTGGTGTSRITANVTFESDAMVNIAAGAQLNLDGAVTFHGGGDIDGILNVTDPWSTSNASQLELGGGEVTGATITNNGTTSGFGLITTSQFQNNGTLAAVGGTLVIDTISSPDLDGTGNGVVSAEGGDIVVVDPIFTTFAGTVTVGAGRTITFQGGWSLSGDGVLNLNGGPTHAQYARVDGEVMGLAADVIVDWEGRFYAPTWFWPDARVSLPDNDDSLRLYEDAAVAAGATFSGSGDLANAQGATLTLDDGASVGVRLINSGRLEIGSSAGVATVAGYYPTNLGSLEIEIGGRVAGSEFDRLLIDGEAMLAGILDVSLIDPEGGANVFIPGAGDTFEIVTATGGLGDTAFTSTLLPELSGGLFFDVLYGPNAVTLMVSILGDFDLDGDVDGADFLAWQRGESPHPLSSSDLNDWRENFGNVASSMNAASTGIPEPSSFVLLLGMAALLFRRHAVVS